MTAHAAVGGRGRPGLPARIAVTLLLLAALLACTFNAADRQAADWVGRSLERALITFAAARALNGAISVAQSTEVAVQPAGVGVAIEPGQILDPINDLIERFSWVMLTASASLGVQLLMVEFSHHPVANTLVATLIAVTLGLLWLPLPTWLSAWRTPVLRLALSAIVLRFAVTVVALASNAAGEFLLADREAASLAAVQLASEQVEALSAEPQADTGTSWWAGAREQFDLVAGARQRLEDLLEDVEAATRAIIDVIAMYTLQTVLLPLLISWLVIAALRRIWR